MIEYGFRIKCHALCRPPSWLDCRSWTVSVNREHTVDEGQKCQEIDETIPLPYYGAVTGSFALDTLGFLYVTIVPGLALAYTALDKRDVLAWVTIGLVLGVFGLPILYFTLAMILRTNINPTLLLSTSTVVLLITGIRQHWRKQNQTKTEASTGC